jgi:hypothetical protein
MIRRLVRVLWIAVFAAGNAAVAANFDPAQIAAIDKAADAFAEMGKDAYKTGTPPRLSDATVKALLDVIFATEKLNDGPDSVPFERLDKLNDWLLRVVKTGMVYVFAGTGIADFEKAASVDAKAQQQTQQRIAANTVAFAPEMGRYYDAQLAVSRALIDSVTTELTAHPDKLTSAAATSGLAQMRNGMTQTLIGVVTTFMVPGIEPAWMRERELVLVAIAPSAAKFLDPGQRKKVGDTTLQVANSMSDQAVKDGLVAFAKTISPP